MWSIGVDLGGTKTDVALVDGNGGVVRRVNFETKPDRKPEEVLDDVAKSVRELRSHIDLDPVGVGVGVAGQVEKRTGKVIFAPNLRWHNVLVQDYLIQATGLPVTITNDVRAATKGEWLYGAGRDCLNFICIFIGTGIGSGIVIEGQLLEGWNNAAGEMGHMILDVNGTLCSCGNYGCLEAYAGGWGLAKQAKDLLENDRNTPSTLRSIQDLSAKDVIEASKNNDSIAKKVLVTGENALIAAIASLLNVINPQKVIIGGGLASGWPNLMETLKEGVKKRALKVTSSEVEIIPAIRGTDAGVIGAASLFT